MGDVVAGGFTETFHRSADGLRLYARDYRPADAGPGRLPVVCLPGLTRNARDFHELALLLSRHAALPRRVIALDYRGRGRSDYDPNPANYSIATELADLLAVLAALAVEPAVFIGTSRGGILAMLLATVRPGAIAGVVLPTLPPQPATPSK